MAASRAASRSVSKNVAQILHRQRGQLGDRTFAEAQVQRHGIQARAMTVGQATSAAGILSARSIHCDSSPVCSASKSSTRTPVPKQLWHQPWLELNDNRRGSGSGNPRPQEGQARRRGERFDAPPGDSTLTTPLPSFERAVHRRAQCVLPGAACTAAAPPAVRWCARRSASGSETDRSAPICRPRAAARRRVLPPSAPARDSVPCGARSAAPAAAWCLPR